jgi:hypothetical protein
LDLDAAVYRFDQGVILFVFFALLVLIAEIGTRLGLSEFGKGRSQRHPLLEMASSASLGILGLLLGFTFSMAVSRFDARRQWVLQESNDIGTAYLRTQLLPKPQSETLAALLRQYVDNRIAIYSPGQAATRTAEIQQGLALQDRLWAETMAAANGSPVSVYTGLFIQALNSVFDSHSARLDADLNHVPGTAILLLVFVALLCLGMLGYQGALTGTRSFLATTALSLLFSLVVVVIIDMDRPVSGLIRVSQWPMLELQRSMKAQ